MRRYTGADDPEEYLLKKHCLVAVAPREILDLLSLERRTLQRDSDVLETVNVIVVEGSGRGVRYRIIDTEV